MIALRTRTELEALVLRLKRRLGKSTQRQREIEEELGRTRALLRRLPALIAMLETAGDLVEAGTETSAAAYNVRTVAKQLRGFLPPADGGAL